MYFSRKHPKRNEWQDAERGNQWNAGTKGSEVCNLTAVFAIEQAFRLRSGGEHQQQETKIVEKEKDGSGRAARGGTSVSRQKFGRQRRREVTEERWSQQNTGEYFPDNFWLLQTSEEMPEDAGGSQQKKQKYRQ